LIHLISIAELLELVRTDWQAVPQFVRDAYESGLLMLAPDHIILRIETGVQIGAVGKWLVRDENGNLRIMSYRDVIRFIN
jgi:hypothetical protein